MKKTDTYLIHFLKSTKYYLGLILIIIIILIWNYNRIHFLEKRAEKEKLEIVARYDKKLDSLNAVNIQLLQKLILGQ